MIHADLAEQIRKAVYGVLLIGLVGTLLSGCAATSGAVAGAAVASGGHIEYYLLTNEVEPHVEECLRNGDLCTGMTPTEVRLVMDADPHWPAWPEDKKSTEEGKLWVFTHNEGNDQTRVWFENETVVDFEED